MKKIMFFIILVLASRLAFAGEVIRRVQHLPVGEEIVYVQDGEEIGRQVIDDNNKVVRQYGKIPDGIVKSYYGNKNIMEELQYKNSRPNGPYKEYYENGDLKREGTMKDGVLVGKVKEYSSTGRVTEIAAPPEAMGAAVLETEQGPTVVAPVEEPVLSEDDLEPPGAEDQLEREEDDFMEPAPGVLETPPLESQTDEPEGIIEFEKNEMSGPAQDFDSGLDDDSILPDTDSGQDIGDDFMDSGRK